MRSPEQVAQRAEQIKAVYRRRREELKPHLRSWCNVLDVVPETIDRARAIENDKSRGEAYLDMACKLLAVAEDVGTSFTIAEGEWHYRELKLP